MAFSKESGIAMSDMYKYLHKNAVPLKEHRVTLVKLLDLDPTVLDISISNTRRGGVSKWAI